MKLLKTSYQSQVPSSHLNRGWATIELVMLLPFIVGLICVLFYFGQLSFFKLHLTSVVDAATRIAAIKDCSSGTQFVLNSFTSIKEQMKINCHGNEYISMSVTTKYTSTMPFFNFIEKEVKVSASALNEKKLSEQLSE